MKLHLGERLSGSGPANQPGGYIVTGVVRETPWCGLYLGKKVFYNFDFTSKRPREADEKEWLDVFLRTINYPRVNDAEYVVGRRALARAEARRTLGACSSNCWPEPLEVLEVVNTRDPFSFARPETARALEPDPLGLEPILVFARPHGEFLEEWQQSVLPLASLLSVLAELLDFISLAHDEGLVLQNLSPATVLVDRVDRVFYLGADMVVAAADRPDMDFFPPERLARGYAGPECFAGDRALDRRSDVYAWASIAYGILTGDRPAEIARGQAQPWATFEPFHFLKLEKALRGVPPAHVESWAEQMALDPEALLAHWPANLLALFRLLLSAEVRRRPASVAELRAWVLVPPPPPAAALLAVRSGTDDARIFLDLTDVDADLDIVVRRGLHEPPGSPDEGQLVADGPQRGVVEDKRVPQGEVHYAVFVRRRQGDDLAFSLPTTAQLLDPAPTRLLEAAETAFAVGRVDDAEPSQLALWFRALDPAGVAEVLLRSRLPHLRGWAIRRLGQMRQGTSVPPTDGLLWQALHDLEPALRFQAARALVSGADSSNLDVVTRVVMELGGGSLDDAIEAARALAQVGLPEQTVQRTIEALEEDRATACPECQLEAPRRERAEHLIRVHGYVDVFGTLLPRGPALARLWDRVFLQADVAAHQRLYALLANGEAPEKPGLSEPYIEALRLELVHRDSRQSPGTPGPAIHAERLVQCLREATPGAGAGVEMLHAGDARVREVGRECLLPELRQRVAKTEGKAGDVRGVLEALVPAGLLEEKILLCARLADYGVAAPAIDGCLAQLEQERLVRCTECQAAVRRADLEAHLRSAHGIFQFRGVRRSYAEMRTALLEAVCTPSPDYAAWTTLEVITRERHGVEADGRLVGWLGQTLRNVSREQRPAALGSLAEAITAAGSGRRLVGALVPPVKIAALEVANRHLALEIVARLPSPVPAEVMQAVGPSLADRRVPRESRQNTVAALLRTTGNRGEQARALLEAYLADSGKLRAIDKLHQLEQRVGSMPVIDALCGKFEDQVRMDCPRCATQLRRIEMVQHLWDRHRLVLEGRRVREPWRVMEDWLEDYRLEKDPAVLHRCRDLVRRLDPEHGPLRLQRLLLRHGIEDAEALAAVLGHARQSHACLCPHCYDRVPVPREPLVPLLQVDTNLLEGGGYRVHISERGLVPAVEVETPDGVVHDGRQPGRWLTRNGFLVVMVGSLMLTAFVMTEILTGSRLHPAVTLSAALGVGLFLAGLVYVLWPAAANPLDRLLDLAWALLVPQLHERRFRAEDAAFVAGLTQLSLDAGHPRRRAESLEDVREVTEEAYRQDAVPLVYLAMLWRLTIADLQAGELDPVPLLVTQVGRCLAARMPLRFAGTLLHGIVHKQDRPLWSDGQWHRLQVLLCERAFQEGLEISELVDLGRAEPDLGKAMALDDIDGLAQRRLLWSQRDTRPWERWGGAATAFEIAASPAGEALLARFPDLLLANRSALPIYLCCRGIYFEELWITEMPRTIEIISRDVYQGDEGYDLVIGSQRIRCDRNPERLADRLEGWLRYYFREFRPLVPALHQRRAPEMLRKLKDRNAALCPSCRRPLLLRPGEVGVALEEAGHHLGRHLNVIVL